jgi:hypothetical protein
VKKCEFQQIMEETECGYYGDDSQPYYCPTDIEGITDEDLSDDGIHCKCSCYSCWLHVLNFKKWEE